MTESDVRLPMFNEFLFRNGFKRFDATKATKLNLLDVYG